VSKTYPATTRSSRTELRRELRRKSPKTEFDSCRCANDEVCINIRFRAIMVVTLRVDAREIFGTMNVKIWLNVSLSSD
jgi:hypothetical protein